MWVLRPKLPPLRRVLTTDPPPPHHATSPGHKCPTPILLFGSPLALLSSHQQFTVVLFSSHAALSKGLPVQLLEDCLLLDPLSLVQCVVAKALELLVISSLLYLLLKELLMESTCLMTLLFLFFFFNFALLF